MNESKSELTKEFLANFNSPLEAVQSIRDYTTGQKKQKLNNRPAIGAGAPTIIQTINLSRTYKVDKTRVKALKNINLTIKQGEFIALTGASGSGKSTLLQLIGGLDKPTSGEVIVNDINIAKLSDAKLSEFRNKTIGFVFQFFYLQPFLNVQTNIEVPAMFAHTKSVVRHQLASEITKAVQMNDRLNHKPSELSGGQMQRAAIARALINRPKLLLADEPTGNLDSKTSSQIIDLFEQIRRELNTTVVIVTHDPNIAARADREIKMLDGEII